MNQNSLHTINIFCGWGAGGHRGGGERGQAGRGEEGRGKEGGEGKEPGQRKGNNFFFFLILQLL